ncbi:hypothetical protein ACIGXI_37720 [Kitasatospora aureofaciens]|uniref:hypothetical protein n=1 Tax=Kitasatospora aureofaciens TaxID=1894 RepID=UPI0037C8DA4A
MQHTVRSRAVLLGAAAYLGVQFWHTFRNRNSWPFCAYNMFTYELPDRWQQFRVVLHDSAGGVTGPVDPWPLLPVEFFRVVAIMNRMFFVNEDAELRTRFCARTLDLLNRTSWADFDEVRASFRAPAGAEFTALDVYLVEVDRDCDAVDRSSVRSAQLIHRHDPTGAAAGTTVHWPYETSR